MSCIGLPFIRMDMDILRRRFVLLVIGLQTVLCFSHFGQVHAQDLYFPIKVLQLAQSSLCKCLTACQPGDMEPETICFSACDCPARHELKTLAVAKCDPYGDCTCQKSPDVTCPFNTIQLCTFENGKFCEYNEKFCVADTDKKKEQCICKDGWTGPNCNVCVNCDGGGANSEAANNLTAMILGTLLVIVVLALLCLVIMYWRKGRLPCHSNKPLINNKKADPNKPPLGNAYSVSGPMAITGQGGTATKRPPDADTGEIDSEYTYADINEYATIGARERSMRPAVPSAPVPSVAAAKTAQSSPYYFQVLQGNTSDETDSTTKTATKPTTADNYTKVVRKPKDEKPKPPVSQYDCLDRSNMKPPTSGDGSPSDNEYGTLGLSLKSEQILP